VECLEEGYVGLAMSEADISRYYRAAEEYLARCKGEQPKAAPQASAARKSAASQRKEPEVRVYPTGRAREQAAAARRGEQGTAQRKSAPGRAASATRSGRTGAKRKQAAKTPARRQKGQQRVSKLFVALAFFVLALGLVLRARTMGIF
jgi:cobalamin biosynthesis Mg chelatase CobN